MFLTHVSPASLLDVYGGFTTRCLWWLNQDDWNRLIVGLITHIVIYLTVMKPVREAKARLWAVAPSMMMMMMFPFEVDTR
jgi:hypothetical protein